MAGGMEGVGGHPRKGIRQKRGDEFEGAKLQHGITEIIDCGVQAEGKNEFR